MGKGLPLRQLPQLVNDFLIRRAVVDGLPDVLPLDLARSIWHKCSRCGHTIVPKIVDTIFPHHFCCRVIQDRKFQTQAFSNVGGLGKVVGADGDYVGLQAGDCFVVPLQLCQWRTAIDSPEGPVKAQDNVAPLQEFIQRYLLAQRAGQYEAIGPAIRL